MSTLGTLRAFCGVQREEEVAVNRARRRVLMIVGIGVALLVAGLVVFQPWLLFVNTTVNDRLPTPAAGDQPAASSAAAGAPSAAASSPAGPVLLARGRFVSHEHETTGTAGVYRLADGSLQLVLSDLRTSNGPDVRVWLSAGPVVEGRAGWYTAGTYEHLEVAPIKGNRGNQVYPLPAGTDLSRWRSVVLWCEDFSVSFGAAALA